MQNDPVTLQAVSAFPHDLGDTLVKGISEGDVGDHTPLEVGPWPHTLGTVNDLVRNDKVARLDCLLETTDSREGDDAPDPDGAQSGNVRAGGNLVRGDLVVRAVSAQECDSNGLVVVFALVVQDGDRGGGFTPGSRDRQRGNLGEARELTESGAADDSNWDKPYAICDGQHGSGVKEAERRLLGGFETHAPS